MDPDREGHRKDNIRSSRIFFGRCLRPSHTLLFGGYKFGRVVRRRIQVLVLLSVSKHRERTEFSNRIPAVSPTSALDTEGRGTGSDAWTRKVCNVAPSLLVYDNRAADRTVRGSPGGHAVQTKKLIMRLLVTTNECDEHPQRHSSGSGVQVSMSMKKSITATEEASTVLISAFDTLKCCQRPTQRRESGRQLFMSLLDSITSDLAEQARYVMPAQYQPSTKPSSAAPHKVATLKNTNHTDDNNITVSH